MSKVGSIEVYVRPTIDLESAVACVTMLNLFVKSDDKHVVIQHGDGTLEIVEAVRV